MPFFIFNCQAALSGVSIVAWLSIPTQVGTPFGAFFGIDFVMLGIGKSWRIVSGGRMLNAAVFPWTREWIEGSGRFGISS